jgi:predicted aspartyl protease
MSATPLVSARFPYLPLTLRVRRYTTTVLALLDTGFDGDIVLPLDLLPAGLAPDAYFRWMLADGTRIQAPTYDGTVVMGQLNSADSSHSRS